MNKGLKALEIIKEIIEKDEETDYMSLFGYSIVKMYENDKSVENYFDLLKEELS